MIIISYHEILSKAVRDSGLSMREICKLSANQGVKISQGYISQLCRGEVSPASDRVNKALACILSKTSDLTEEELIVAAYRVKIPEEILKVLISNIV